jgi:DNA (cytosine-5)-methyltransferase 1
MNELSLFSGAGGGLLGTKLLGWRNIGYVEHERYCQQIISQRIKDGILDEAPIFGDIDSFIESGAAKKYKGFVDVVTAGFPCQPFSVAGKQAGEDDPRNKWPQTIQCIRDIRPRYAFLENVPGLLNSGYFPEILGSLAEAGFDARWVVLGADDVGAPHRRKRLWIVADSDTGHGIQSDKTLRAGGLTSDNGSQYAYNAEKPSRPWPPEPELGRVTSDGVAHRVDRLKAIGNGQVPLVVAQAWEILK